MIVRPMLPGIRAIEAEMIELRRQLHAYPELSLKGWSEVAMCF
ncbi:hypothetical protein AN403_6097 [Pseudomonas fluorescens]|uniref:Amidohydrolase n=1 Tax=Pseudomonas fluorescens TaxID=294 RepID=A0A0N8NY59_PSEFL|nr:hypothetical protein [Pseudomonas fluorescens]KPU62089.1 hypothetical protein AN403_6097 [Pseudomonas fluorescens]